MPQRWVDQSASGRARLRERRWRNGRRRQNSPWSRVSFRPRARRRVRPSSFGLPGDADQQFDRTVGERLLDNGMPALPRFERRLLDGVELKELVEALAIAPMVFVIVEL